jgi:ADP-heptose:LPS heptosyltransferase
MADVLVLRALGIGDLLVAVPALRGLRREFSTRRLILAAPAWLAPLVELTGCVDLLEPTPRLGTLRWPSPDIAVNLHGAGPESIEDLAATAPGVLLTHRHAAFGDLAGPDWVEELHEARRWCRLLGWHGIAAEPTDLGLRRPASVSAAPDAVVVHPGASVPTRRWPAARFAEVAKQLAADGHQVVVTGSADEQPLAAEVAAGAGLPDSSVLAGRLALAELAAVVADAALVVSNDTGVGHLATAYGTPSVLLFGPTPPARWGPPTDRKQHAVLWAGRRGEPFGEAVHEGLLELTVPDVTAAAGRVLSVHS